MDDVEIAFLRAIANEPDRDLPRLAYADWLEEQGFARRAEFIRIQCEIVHGYAGAPPPTGKALTKLSLREKMLVNEMLAPAMPGRIQNIRELNPEIASIVSGDPNRITFNRGMINNLDLTETQIATLPVGLHVGGSLSLYGTPIKALPTDLYVGGNLILVRSKIKALPIGLHVGGNLSLVETRIAELPAGLRVGGSLYLNGTQISTLPADLQVSGNLDLTRTRITSLPNGLRIGGGLNLSGTRITTLPADLHVVGDLDLSDTRLTVEAAQRILTMPNLSRYAKVTGLETAGFQALANQAHRDTVNDRQGRQP